RLHLVELPGQLGRLSDAIAGWTDAAQRAPLHKASHQALAEALLGTGEAAKAQESAAAVLALESDNARAKAIVAIGRLGSGDHAAADSIREAIARNPEIFLSEAIGGSLALVLEREAQRETGAAIIDAV